MSHKKHKKHIKEKKELFLFLCIFVAKKI